MEKFDRICRLFGTKQVLFLQQQRVAIVGCGGVGGYVIEALARSNIGHLILIDYDAIAPSNINRQIIALDQTVGTIKVEAWKERVAGINKDCKVYVHADRLTEENIDTFIPKDVSYVVDACDDCRAKKALISYCIKEKLPFISSMGTGKRKDPSKVILTTLDKTKDDPLARVLRKYVKDAGITSKIEVCCSTEVPQKRNDSVIASCVFVPAVAGMMIASSVVEHLQKRSKLYDERF